MIQTVIFILKRTSATFLKSELIHGFMVIRDTHTAQPPPIRFAINLSYDILTTRIHRNSTISELSNNPVQMKT